MPRISNSKPQSSRSCQSWLLRHTCHYQTRSNISESTPTTHLIATKHNTAYQIANWRSDNPRSTNLLPQSSVAVPGQGFACPATSKPSSPPSTTSQSPLSTPTQWVRWISPHTSPDCLCARAIWTRAVSELHRHCPDRTVYIYIRRAQLIIVHRIDLSPANLHFFVIDLIHYGGRKARGYY